MVVTGFFVLWKVYCNTIYDIQVLQKAAITGINCLVQMFGLSIVDIYFALAGVIESALFTHTARTI